MKRILLLFVLLVGSLPSLLFANPHSVIGAGSMKSRNAHNLGVGWPSLSYEWWNKGNPDWALGAEIVYGDWSGKFSDVEIGFGMNVPVRWHLRTYKKAEIAFRAVPGILLARTEDPSSTFAFGFRGEMGIPISIELAPKFNIVTGVVVPFSVLKVKGVSDPAVIIPIMPRMGVEVFPDAQVSVWFLMELGPAIYAGPGPNDVDLAFRGTVGVTFW